MIDFLTEIRKNEQNHGNLPSRDPNWRYEILIYFFIKGNQIRLWNQFLPPLSTLSYRTTKEKEKNRIEIEKTTNRRNIYLANSQHTNLRKKAIFIKSESHENFRRGLKMPTQTKLLEQMESNPDALLEVK